jgi:hypothetical protein
MVGKSSGTLCGVGPPSFEVMEEERAGKSCDWVPGIKHWSDRRGSQFTTLRNNYCSTDIDFGFSTGREEF